MIESDAQHLRVLIANEKRDRLELLAQVVIGLGHDVMLFQNDAYLRHVLGGILWAAGAAAGDCRP